MQIDCKQCVMYQTEHCDDCLVTALLHPVEAPVEIESEMDAPLSALAEVGLIPVLKFRARAEAAGAENPAAGSRAHIA